MTENRLERKLAAILYADVAGYSRLTGEDEVGTHTVLSERLDAFAAAVVRRGGHVGHFAGDAILADFPSVISALSCAVEVQRDFAARNESVSEDRQVRFRVGINLGEVIADRGEVYGDGVNVAARLEALAEPGGICVSESVHLALGNKLPLDYQDIGEQQVKNITNPVRAYRVVVRTDTMLPTETSIQSGAGVESRAAWRRVLAAAVALVALATIILLITYPAPDVGPTAVERQPIATSTKPAIAILPFENLSPDPEQEYFADGMTHDLITDLSQISGLFVLARHAVFAYKDTAINTQQVGEELGVRYILEGSVRKAGARVRINAQLIDTATGGHLWAERYDGRLVDIFDVQDEVTKKIVAALAVKLTQQEQDLLARRYTDSPEAYDYFLRGQEHYFRLTEEDNARARDLYRIAIEYDPGFGRAYGALAITYARPVLYGWSGDPEESLEQAQTLAQRAVTLDDQLPQVHWALGFVYLLGKQHEQAIAAAERAIAVDPNYAEGYGLLAWIHSFAGQPELAIELIGQAMEIDPTPGDLFLSVLGEAQYWSGHFDEAMATFEEIVATNPNLIDSRLHLAATYSRLGRHDEAEWEVQEILSLNPDFTLAKLERRSPVQDPGQLKHLLDDLRRAGLK